MGGYACIHYINQVLKGAIPELCNDLPVPGFLKWAFGAKSKMQEMVESIIEGNKDLISKPLPGVGGDHPTNGKEEEEPAARLRDVEYERQSIEVLAEMHNFLVGNNAGPGLAYTP